MKLIGANLITLLLFISVSAAPESPAISTSADQKAVYITIYNSSLALVKDVRTVKLGSGDGELRFTDVAAQIMPATVRAQSISRPEDFSVLEQNYEYDLINSGKLLDKYVGKKIKIIDINEYKGTREEMEAVLLSNNDGQIFKINNEIYLGYPGLKVLPEMPDNLIANPTLMWLYASKRSGPHELEVSYLTNGISWVADYVLVLDVNDRKGDISGWVTIDNQSGAAYKDASLKIVAGEINRAPEAEMRPMMMAKGMARVAEEADRGFTEKEFFEYHIYDLQRKTTIKNNQTKQINLLEASGFSVTKQFLTHGQNWYYSRRYNADGKQPVEVFLDFKNARQNKLGMPLPAGTIRVYKRDSEGSQQFVGEDNIDHTPKDEEIKIKLGKAFDIIAERKQTDYKEVGSRAYESAWEIVLRNHKQEPATVGVVEHLQGDWKITGKNHDYKKLDAFTVQFDVQVPKDGEAKVQYRVRVDL